MSTLKILKAITPSGIGGAELFVVNACRAFLGLKADVRLFCPAGRPFVDYSRERGLTPTTWKTSGKVDPVTVFKLARLIRQERFNVIHTHLSTASLLGALAARLAGVPSVAHVHGLNSATCYRYSTALIAVSEAVKAHLCTQGVRPEKIHVIHNGVDLVRFKPRPLSEAKHALGYDTHTPLFGVFGRLSPEKGQEVAIEAMAQLAASVPDALLLLIGEGKDRERLARFAATLGIEKNIVFAGFRKDVREVMAACDAVIVPSRKEGFGLTAAEAMALGRPVIATAVGGLPEIVVDGDTGLLVRPNDPHALAAALEAVAHDPVMAGTMGAHGRKRAERLFDLQAQMAKVLSLLNGTVAPAPRLRQEYATVKNVLRSIMLLSVPHLHEQAHLLTWC